MRKDYVDILHKRAMHMEKKDIGKLLKESRKKLGKTQSEIASLLGTSQQVVGHWETGYSQPDSQTFIKLCNILEISLPGDFAIKDLIDKSKTTDQIIKDPLFLALIQNLVKENMSEKVLGEISSGNLEVVQKLVKKIVFETLMSIEEEKKQIARETNKDE